jgi:hypothetical protein
MSQISTTNTEKRNFLKTLFLSLAVFSFGGFTSVITKSASAKIAKSKGGYGSIPYGG